MLEKYFLAKDFHFTESVDQGTNIWINYPNPVSPGLFAAIAEISPGKGHDFHCHPGREELIVVMQGSIEQWIGETCKVLTKGDAVMIPEGLAHASFNTGTIPVTLFVSLTHPELELPLAEDLSAQEPWRTLRSKHSSL